MNSDRLIDLAHVTKLDTFTTAYLTTALWTEDLEPGSGEYQPSGDWTIDNMAPEAMERAIADCATFQSAHWDDISDDPSQAGHDFWLTRNGHGCGFWDGDWPDDVGTRLTDASEAYGEVDLYLGDDGRLYFS